MRAVGLGRQWPTKESHYSRRYCMRTHLVAAIAAATVSLTMSAHAASLTGAGGTAIYPVLSKWADTYAKEEGDTNILLATVFGAHLQAAGDLVAAAGEQRWGSSTDLPDALERLGVIAIVQAAGDDGDRVERELFSFGRTVTESADLRDALSEPSRSIADKQALIRSLLEPTAAPATVRLAQETVTGARRTVSAAVEDLIEITAEARSRDVATVRTAHELSDQQLERLAAALGRQSGRDVQVNVVVDPDVLGGVRVEIGDDVIDGTIASRLDDARPLAG